MMRSRWMLLMGLAGFLGLPVACTQSLMVPDGPGSSIDFFHFHRTPTPTRTPTPLSTPTTKVTGTVTPSTSATPVAASPSPSPSATFCVQNVLCIQGKHWDPSVCGCVPDATSTPSVVSTSEATATSTFTPTAPAPTFTPTPMVSPTKAIPTQSPTIMATCNPVAVLGNDLAGSAPLDASQLAVYAQPETATASGDLTRVSINVQTPPLSLDGMIGVYSDSSGQPGSLLAHSAFFTSLSAGVNAFAVPAIPLAQGTRYWLALYIDSLNEGNLVVDQAPAPGPLVRYSTIQLNILPNSLSELTVNGEFNAVLDMEGDICQ